MRIAAPLLLLCLLLCAPRVHDVRGPLRGTSCRLDRVHRHDEAGLRHRHKTQRLVCRDGRRSLSAYLVLNEAA